MKLPLSAAEDRIKQLTEALEAFCVAWETACSGYDGLTSNSSDRLESACERSRQLLKDNK